MLSAVIAKEILTTQTEHKKERCLCWQPLQKCIPWHWQAVLATAR